QAEDGIRDDLVTGVQTCALPIFFRATTSADRNQWPPPLSESREKTKTLTLRRATSLRFDRPQWWTSTARSRERPQTGSGRRRSRSEERRVGNGRRSRAKTEHG